LKQGEVALPVTEEELRVGKREVQGGGVRVYSKVTEKPVQADVNLREEHVHVERRTVDRPLTEADKANAFKEGTIEVTEKSEEAVVDKQARVKEEVVVRKDVNQRTETIKDTVKRTDVQVEQIPAAGSSTSSSVSANTSDDFRKNYDTSFANSGYTYEQFQPVYRYGQELASSDQYRGRDWKDIESDAQKNWESRNPGTWTKFKDAARYAWDKARDKVSR